MKKKFKYTVCKLFNYSIINKALKSGEYNGININLLEPNNNIIFNTNQFSPHKKETLPYNIILNNLILFLRSKLTPLLFKEVNNFLYIEFNKYKNENQDYNITQSCNTSLPNTITLCSESFIRNNLNYNNNIIVNNSPKSKLNKLTNNNQQSYNIKSIISMSNKKSKEKEMFFANKRNKNSIN